MRRLKVTGSFSSGFHLFDVKMIHTLKCFLCSDDRFPEYGKVEFIFSFGPEKIHGKHQRVQTSVFTCQSL